VSVVIVLVCRSTVHISAGDLESRPEDTSWNSMLKSFAETSVVLVLNIGTPYYGNHGRLKLLLETYGLYAKLGAKTRKS